MKLSRSACTGIILLFSCAVAFADLADDIEQEVMTRLPDLFVNGQMITNGNIDAIGARKYSAMVETVFSGDVYHVFALTNYDTPLRKKIFEQSERYKRYQRRLETLEDQFRKIEWTATLTRDGDVVYDLKTGMLLTKIRWINHFNWTCSGFFAGKPVYRTGTVSPQGELTLHLYGQPAKEHEYAPSTSLVLECPVSEQQAAALEKAPLVKIKYKVVWQSYVADVSLAFHDASDNVLATLPVRESLKQRAGRWRYELEQHQQHSPFPPVLKAEIPDSGTGYRYEGAGPGQAPRSILVENYTNGVLNGLTRQYSVRLENNRLELVKTAEVNYVNTIKHGVEKTYYKDGKIKVETAYRQGELHGPMIQYGRNGTVIRKLSYIQGKPHGPAMARGTYDIDANFVNGVPTGYCTLKRRNVTIRLFFWNNGANMRAQYVVKDKVTEDKTYTKAGSDYQMIYKMLQVYLLDPPGADE